MRRLIVGISGATGVQIGLRLLEVLHDMPDIEVHLVVPTGAELIYDCETDANMDDVRALMSPGPPLHGERLSHCDLWVSIVPGHKDAEAAREAARRLCLATSEPVSVAAGVLKAYHAAPERSDKAKHRFLCA